jgi:flagellar motor switch protein FliN
MAVSEEILSKLKESLSTRIAQAMEAMTGANQRVYLVPEMDPEQEKPAEGTLLGWRTDYSAGSGVGVRLFAGPESWKLIGKTVLLAAGVDEFDDPTLESTFTETLAQAGSAWSADLSGIAGRKWEATSSGTGATPEASATTWGYRLPFGDGEAKVMVQVTAELLGALVQTPEPAQPAMPIPGSVPSGDGTQIAGIPPSQFELLLDVELPVSVSFGRSLVPLKEVLKLSSGSIVELNRAVTEPVEVIVNNCVIARGEVVVVEGNYGVRIQQIVSRQDRLRSVH